MKKKTFYLVYQPYGEGSSVPEYGLYTTVKLADKEIERLQSGKSEYGENEDFETLESMQLSLIE